jgi:hypothetical protein
MGALSKSRDKRPGLDLTRLSPTIVRLSYPLLRAGPDTFGPAFRIEYILGIDYNWNL